MHRSLCLLTCVCATRATQATEEAGCVGSEAYSSPNPFAFLEWPGPDGTVYTGTTVPSVPTAGVGVAFPGGYVKLVKAGTYIGQEFDIVGRIPDELTNYGSTSLQTADVAYWNPGSNAPQALIVNGCAPLAA